jgi:TonB-dependent starch-binding outer membrane protein SusC
MKKLLLLVFSVMIMFSTNILAQELSITGNVSDASGPLPGVNILMKGTARGVVTDLDGNYKISAKVGDVLVFSFVGYRDQEITVGNQDVIDVVMAEDAQQLSEVVVTGYGTTLKRDLTGSVSTVRAEDFNLGVFVTPDQLFQGKLSGVQVTSNSGQPGGGITVRVRGNNSVRAGQEPLYVVDGVPMDGRSGRPGLNSTGLGDTPPVSPFNFINADDIENITVLKDASSAAIYGSRAANGVVLITTKEAKTGKAVVNFNAYTGVSNIRNTYDVLNATEYRQALSDYGLSVGDFGDDVNAMDEVTQTGLTQQYNMSLSGGAGNSLYRVSVGYLDQEGIIKETGIKRLSSSFNSTHKLIDNRFVIDTRLILSQTKEKIAPISTNAGFTGNVVGQALQWNPTLALYDDTSTGTNGFNVLTGSTTINPAAYLAAYTDEADVNTVLASFSPSFKLTEAITLKYQFGLNRSAGIRRSQTRAWINVQDVEDRGVASLGNQILTSSQHLLTAAYSKQVNLNLKVNAVLGYEFQKFDLEGSFLTGRDFGFEDVDYFNIMQSTSQGTRQISSFADPTSKIESVFLRAGVTIKNNITIQAILRNDGSSKFGANNKRATFPSISGGWTISNESFFGTDLFDNLKLRAGWGKLGNQEFPAGASLTRYQVNDQGSVQRTNAQNPDLKWETTTTINVGLDFSLFNYRLNGTIEYFNKATSDLLFLQPLAAPGPAGTSIWRNLEGEIGNTGVDIELNGTVVENDIVEWNIGVFATLISNKLTGYTGAPIPTGGLFGQGISGATSQQIANNQPVNVFYLRNFQGIDASGQSIYADNETLSYLGDPNPTTLLGITSTVTVSKFYANIAFNGAYGHDIYNNTKNTVIPIGNLGTRNVDANLVNVSPQEATSNPIVASSRYLEKGNYLKLANMTVGYSFGNAGVVRNINVFVTGTNLAVFTKYSGFDPEVNTVNFNSNGVPSLGIEYIPYPQNRTFLLGVSFSL